MLNPNASFPSQTNAPDTDYPQGSAKNVSAPGAGDGTPWVAPLLNDVWGFMQALVANAAITPSGDPDTAVASDVFDAMNSLFNQTAAGTTSTPGLVQLSNNPSSTSDALAATIGALNALRTLSVPEVVATSSATAWCIKWGKVKIQGGTKTVNSSTQTVSLSTLPQSVYTGTHLAFFAWINDNSGGGNNEPISATVVNSSSGAIRSNSGQNNFTGYISVGFDV